MAILHLSHTCIMGVTNQLPIFIVMAVYTGIYAFAVIGTITETHN